MTTLSPFVDLQWARRDDLPDDRGRVALVFADGRRERDEAHRDELLVHAQLSVEMTVGLLTEWGHSERIAEELSYGGHVFRYESGHRFRSLVMSASS